MGSSNINTATNRNRQAKKLTTPPPTNTSNESSRIGEDKITTPDKMIPHLQERNRCRMGYNTQQKRPKLDPSTCMKCGDTRHKPGFKCPASHYQWKKCQKWTFNHCCLTKVSKVNHINKNKPDKLEYLQQSESDYSDNDVHIINASGKENFHICNLRTQKHKGKKGIYANLQIDCMNNYLCTQVDTAANVNLMPASVCKQMYGDLKLGLLQPMDINLSICNENAIQILLISPVNGCKYNTKFYIADHDESILFSCQDSLYVQFVKPHPPISKSVPSTGHIISSNHDRAYINFVNRNKSASHYTAAQCSAPIQAKFTPKQMNFIPFNLEQIKEKYGDISKALASFQGNHTTST